ncbi:MAG: hypothetical protein HY815_34270 [Candidatus Riflebacteria bacterium]|nr:hypothetical protein [Candidatus Riflebacteria bacterium]
MTCSIRLFATTLVVLALLCPAIAPRPALAMNPYHGNAFLMAVRVVPALAGTVAGWMLGAHFGMVGKVVGGLVGFQVGKWVGKFISRQIGDVVYDPYPFPYAPGTTGSVSGLLPSSPSTTAPSLTALRERWLKALGEYQTALESPDQPARSRARAAYDRAQDEYQRAKAAAPAR